MARAADRAVAPMVALPATPTQPAMAVCAPMRTLWPIWIRLSSFTPSSITVSSQRAAVDAGVGADLHVVADAHRAQLLDLDPAPRRWARSRSRRRRSPRRGARCSARRCGSRAEGDARCRPAAASERDAAADEAMGAEHRLVTDDGTGFDHDKGADARRWATPSHRARRRPRDGRRRCHRAGPGCPQLGEPRKEVGIVHDQRGTAGAAPARAGGRHDHARRLGRRELRLVLGVGEKGDGRRGRACPAGRGARCAGPGRRSASPPRCAAMSPRRWRSARPLTCPPARSAP